MLKTDKIYIAGHKGVVGSAICRRLNEAGYDNIVTRTHSELNLANQSDVLAFWEAEQPSYVFLVAGKTGNIMQYRDYPADFLSENILIITNVLNAAHKYNAEKLLFIGSGQAYPAICPQPMKEDVLMSGPLDPATESYGLAKLLGTRLCQYYAAQYGRKYITCVPCNIYGTHSNEAFAAALPSMLKRMHEAKQSGAPEVEIWGTGNAVREYLFSDDFADACLFLMEHYNAPEPVNVGCGEGVTIRKLAEAIQKAVGYQGGLFFDITKPEGAPAKLMDISRMNSLGWRNRYSLEEGISMTYRWLLREGILK